MNINHQQRSFFLSKKSQDYEFRKNNLLLLKRAIKLHEKEIFEALKNDLNKSEEESFITEVGFVYAEIDYHLKYLKKWMKPQKVKTNLLNMPGRSEIHYEPYGVTLILGAWNYPVNLTLVPLVGAMSAGNTAVVKPSELAQEVSRIIAKIINNHFPQDYIHVVEGGAEVSSGLLEEQWDYVFYTGGERVGKIVAQACAKNLTPYTLELGGKSPCIVMDDVDLKLAVKRILWGKFLNNGQTCIAPDYLLAPNKIKEALLKELKKQIQSSYHSQIKIINENHFNRLKGLIESPYYEHPVVGERRLGPVIMDINNLDHKVMQEEIFGPLIPVVGFDDLNGAIKLIETKSRPLALYLFSKDHEVQNKIKALSFGGGVINDVVMHISNPYLPFGGVGHSGIGAYHGKWSFETFSHKKSLMIKPLWFDPFIKYPPYSEFKMKLLRFLIK